MFSIDYEEQVHRNSTLMTIEEDNNKKRIIYECNTDGYKKRVYILDRIDDNSYHGILTLFDGECNDEYDDIDIDEEEIDHTVWKKREDGYKIIDIIRVEDDVINIIQDGNIVSIRSLEGYCYLDKNFIPKEGYQYDDRMKEAVRIIKSRK